MLKPLIQSSLKSVGYELRRAWQPPNYKVLDVFAVCMNDLLRKTPKPFIFQVGANDGIGADPVRKFIVEHDLPGLLVEPLPPIFALLLKNYEHQTNLRFENCAVTEKDGKISLFSVDHGLINDAQRLSGLSTFSRDQLIKDLINERVASPASRIIETTVPGYTIGTLLKKHDISRIDVLQVDTEGFDWKVVSQVDLDFYKVQLINMEFNRLRPDEMEACLSHLTGRGFSMIQMLGDLVAYR